MKKAKKVLTLVACAVLLVCISVGATLAYLQATTETVQNTFTVGNVSFWDDPFTDLNDGLTEADVNTDGEPLKDGVVVDDYKEADRVDANEYKLMPGHTYVKDPTVTIAANSEKCYVRMIVTISDIADVKAVMGAAVRESVVDGKFLPQYLVEGWDATKWVSTGVIEEDDDANTATYEFRYYTTVDTLNGENKTLEALFTHIKVPGNVDNDGLTEDVYKKDENGNVVNDENGNPIVEVANVVDLADLEEMQIDIVAHAIQADGFEDATAAWKAWDDGTAAN